MSVEDGPADDATVRDDAARWLVRVQSDAATGQDWVALTTWLEASEAHQAAFDTVERLSAQIADQAAHIARGLDPPLGGVVELRPRPSHARRWAPAAGFAAAAAIALAAGPR